MHPPCFSIAFLHLLCRQAADVYGPPREGKDRINWSGHELYGGNLASAKMRVLGLHNSQGKLGLYVYFGDSQIHGGGDMVRTGVDRGLIGHGRDLISCPHRTIKPHDN